MWMVVSRSFIIFSAGVLWASVTFQHSKWMLHVFAYGNSSNYKWPWSCMWWKKKGFSVFFPQKRSDSAHCAEHPCVTSFSRTTLHCTFPQWIMPVYTFLHSYIFHLREYIYFYLYIFISLPLIKHVTELPDAQSFVKHDSYLVLGISSNFSQAPNVLWEQHKNPEQII